MSRFAPEDIDQSSKRKENALEIPVVNKIVYYLDNKYSIRHFNTKCKQGVCGIHGKCSLRKKKITNFKLNAHHILDLGVI